MQLQQSNLLVSLKLTRNLLVHVLLELWWIYFSHVKGVEFVFIKDSKDYRENGQILRLLWTFLLIGVFCLLRAL